MYFDNPGYPWAAEAGAWLSHVDAKSLWQKAESLVPRDPWETLYFQVNAGWVGATLTWETTRSLLQVLSSDKGSRPSAPWEYAPFRRPALGKEQAQRWAWLQIN